MSEGAPPAPPASQPPNIPPAPSSRSGSPGWLAPALAGIAYLAFWQVVPRIHTPSVGAFMLSTVVSLGLLVWFAASMARALVTPRLAATHAVCLAVVVIPLRVLFVLGLPAVNLLFRFLPGLGDLLFIWFAASLGALLSFLLRGANMIPPVAAVLGLVDVWTVLLGGPVKKIMESPNPAAHAVTQALTVQLPAPSTAGASPAPPLMVIGFADALFIAFFVAAICRFVTRSDTFARTVYALVGLLGLYAVIVLMTGLSLPALVPMAVVMIALHWRQFHYERSELFALLYAGLFILVIIAVFWYFGPILSHSSPGRG